MDPIAEALTHYLFRDFESDMGRAPVMPWAPRSNNDAKPGWVICPHRSKRGVEYRAFPSKKAHRKRVQASRRANR